MAIKIENLSPFRELIDVLAKNIDYLPQEVIECLMKLTKESEDETNKEFSQSHCTRPRN